jgi:hypothetical protein
MVLSIGLFFTLMIAGLSGTLPGALSSGLTAHGVPAADAARIAALPPVGVLFAAFLGYNPVQQLLGPTLATLPAGQADYLTGRSFFPQLITGPFADGLTTAFWFAIAACLVAAAASWFSGTRRPREFHEAVGAELAAEAGELVRDDDARDDTDADTAHAVGRHAARDGARNGIPLVPAPAVHGRHRA